MNRAQGAFTAQISRKRKERDDCSPHNFKSNNHQVSVRGKQIQPHSAYTNTTSLKSKPGEPVRSNRLLAGYMAHEFLTKGTLLGQKFDPAPAQAQAVPLSPPGADHKKKPTLQLPPATATNGHGNGNGNGGQTTESTAREPATEQKMKSYGKVASLLMTDGAHIPGIVNPTQLARWIQM